MEIRTFIKSIALAGVLCTGICSCTNNAELRRERSYYSEVKSVNKLVLAQMTISKMATIDDIDLSKAEGMKQMAAGMLDAMKLGKRRAAYSYDTYLRAYVNLSELTPDDVQVDDATRTITLTLPPVHTEFAGRDMEIREDHYRVSGLRSEIDAQERAEIKEMMNKSLIDEVENKAQFRETLTAEARIKAENYFKAMLGNDGYNVIVKFK
ncbi:MAG: DUF4230 domain-containing protein [Muribaculaceae bacterium]|nr:DUF4230 domain-containing protein [Muribaculaceae bacterium]